jgi:4-amino-4-deoxy-L-arabinose transferase-like glycosyltransferase
LGLSISGAPSLAVIFGLGAMVFELYQLFLSTDQTPRFYRDKAGIIVLLMSTLASAMIASALDLWRWKLDNPLHLASPWQGYMELLLWFTWPAWPLALWTLWVWRRQLWSLHASRHLALPLLVVITVLVASWCMHSSERTLLLALPALSSLAAFALPTLKRQVASLIDWFTLLFFTGWGLVLWVHFIAMFTGIPANPAINIARLAPGFEAQFSWFALGIACISTLAWGRLVHWRVGRHRRELWRSLVLPAGGIAWCWTLMMSMGISLFDYTQSYDRWAALVARQVSAPGCVRSEQLNIGEIAALRWIGNLPISAPTLSNDCPWLLIGPGPNQSLPPQIDTEQWAAKALVLHPADGNIGVWVLQRR